MIKIAMIDYDLSVIGGVEQVLFNMACALKDRYEVHVLSLSRSGECWKYEFPDSVECTDLFEESMRLRQLLTKSRSKIRRYIVERRINLVLFFGYYPAFAVGKWLKSLPCKTVFCDHVAIMSPWNERISFWMRRWASRWVTHTVVLTKQSERAYRKLFPWTKDRISTIYNWIDPVFLESAADYDEESTSLITVARPTEQKGYDFLFQVAEELDKSVSKWEWELYGIEEDQIPPEIRKKDWGDRIHPMGMTSHMEKHYGKHALYVMTSRWEGLPLVLLEAKANHLPIISFDIVSGPSDIVTDGEDGFLIPAYDVQAMAEKIAALLSDQNRRKTMSEKSRLRMELFDKNTVLKKWEKIFSRLLTADKSSRKK